MISFKIFPIFNSYREFFRDTSRQFDRIFYVLGNHEYDRTCIGIDKNNIQLLNEKFQQRKDLIRQIVSESKNITLLDNQGVTIENKRIYGTTLWTNYHEKKSQTPLTNFETFISRQHQLADIDYQKEDKVDILISHFVCNRKILKKSWNIGLGPRKCYASPITIFGHVHYSIRGYDGKNVTICNPWGEDENCSIEIVQVE